LYQGRDSIENFYLPPLHELTAIHDKMTNLRNSVSSYESAHDAERNNDPVIDASDIQNMIVTFGLMLQVLDEALPTAMADPLEKIVSTLRSQAQLVAMTNLRNPANQVIAKVRGQATVGLPLSYDFFNPYYPSKE
jgi:hypothetical protein